MKWEIQGNTLVNITKRVVTSYPPEAFEPAMPQETLGQDELRAMEPKGCYPPDPVEDWDELPAHHRNLLLNNDFVLHTQEPRPWRK